MTHFAYMVAVNRLEIEAHIGFYEKERNEKQPIELSFRLYFAAIPDYAKNDNAHFFDYGKLSEALRHHAEARKYNLIEYMGMELFGCLRQTVDTMGGNDVCLWLALNKTKAPVPGLLGGASFVHSDLPADATFIPSIGS